MKLKIVRANIVNREGMTIVKPNDRIIDESELEDYRKSLKNEESDSILLTYEEIGENES
jgi:hypothetical protein